MFPSATDLIYFYQIAKAGSFSRAALKLHISQPSLSMAIKRLEDLLEDHLFIRHKHGVTLTLSGKHLFDKIDSLKVHWENIKLTMHSIRDELCGKIIIGCHSTIAPFISPLLTDLMNKHSQLEIHLQHAMTANIMEGISLGKIDLGIVVNPQASQDIILNAVGDIEFTLWGNKDCFANFNFECENFTVICDPDLPQTQYLLKQLQINRLKPFRIITANQLETIAVMTENGAGIGILPSCIVRERYDKLIRLPDSPAYTNTLYLAIHYQKKQIASINLVKQALKEYGMSKYSH